MGWVRQGRGRAGGYYYRSVRLPGRPHPAKLYLGAGEEANTVAEAVAKAAADRKTDRAAGAAETARWADADRLLAELAAGVTALVHAALAAAGYHRHRGCWRRRRTLTTEGEMGRRRKAVIDPDAPPPGRWGYRDGGYAQLMLADLRGRARLGDRQAWADLVQLLAENPGLAAGVGDLAARAEGAFADAIGGADAVAAAAARLEAHRLRAALAAGATDPLERLAVDHVVACILADRHAQLRLAEEGGGPAAEAARCKRAAACGRRLHDAVRLLAFFREKRPADPPDAAAAGADPAPPTASAPARPVTLPLPDGVADLV